MVCLLQTVPFQLYSLFHPNDHQPVAADHPLSETDYN